MKCKEEGHVYSLNNTQSSEAQEINFIYRANGQLLRDGTTNEEVLAMLIDRMKYLNTKFACRENSIVITKLEESLHWLNHRTKDRENRSVKGTD